MTFLRTLGLCFLIWLSVCGIVNSIEDSPKAAKWDAFELQVKEIRENNKGMVLP